MAKRRVHLEDPKESIEGFFTCVSQANCKVIIGIDPGKEGALAFLPTGPVRPILIDIPFDVIERQTSRAVKTGESDITKEGKAKKVKRKNKTSRQKQYDMGTLASWFDPVIDFSNGFPGQLLIALERTQPMPRDSSVTAFQMGIGYGMWHLFFSSFGLSYEELQPAVWKRTMGLLKQEKDAGRIKAKKLFPQVASFLAAKGDHNRADALLIAEVARRRWE